MTLAAAVRTCLRVNETPKIIFKVVCPFSRAEPLSPVKAVIKAAYLKEKLP
jgi:hypothetical protein